MSSFIRETDFYKSTMSFNTHLYNYSQDLRRRTGQLIPVEITAMDAAAGVVIKNMGRKLIPGIHPGVSVPMISIGFVGANDGEAHSAFIDPTVLRFNGNFSGPPGPQGPPGPESASKLQDIYNNSIEGAMITTDAMIGGAFQIKCGTYANTDNVFEIFDGSGNNTACITGEGKICALAIDVSGTLAVTGPLSASNFSGTSSGTNTGDQTITLTGGVTGSGTSSIATTVITNANLSGAISSVGNTTTHNYTHVTATTNATTNSTTDVTMTSMTTTPAAGTYLVSFDSTVFNSKNNKTMTISIYSGGTQVAASVRQITTATTASHIGTQAIVTVNGAQAVDVRWHVSANTGTVNQRALTLIRVA